ncbi:glycoprotease family-domain-containing protein [Bombardia bombarda]|uniref:N(6)-L-threonylcarbamoyladenine synthase n=1 Tax=Bombardia bombarda TaxID=252184 RepID=A0AA39WNA6_9PEZI|nr:glycoprotease family-domain-containing protein [Bombardia bombarda]
MSGQRTLGSDPSRPSPDRRSKEEWEEWEDDEATTPIEDGDGPLIKSTPDNPEKTTRTRAGSLTTNTRQSIQKIRRLKSRHRQKAQNVKAGIRLVTDMSLLRQQQQAAQQTKPAPESRTSRTGRYVDAAALNALEGAAMPESTSSFGWLKKKPNQAPKNKKTDKVAAAAETPIEDDVSPIVGPIVIGFAMPSDSDVVISPQTAVVETPLDYPFYFGEPPKPPTSKQQISAWSPDTPDSDEIGASRSYQGTGNIERSSPPPVPTVSRNQRDTRATTFAVSDDEDDSPILRAQRNKRHTTASSFYASGDEDDMETPVTLFEEDGSPVYTRRKSLKARLQKLTSGGRRPESQGWWDQVTSPFGPHSPETVSPNANNKKSKPVLTDEWWKNSGGTGPVNKTVSPSSHIPDLPSGSRSAPEAHRPPRIIVQDFSPVSPIPPTVTASPVSPALTPSPISPILARSTNQAPVPPRAQEAQEQTRGQAQTRAQTEKASAIAEEEPVASDIPPPYSPPSRNNNIRYRAVFPPGHPLNAVYPPSPGPVSPGLTRTMTSQGAINLTDVPLTPAADGLHPSSHARLPDRAPWSFPTGDHFLASGGHGPRQKAERKRRRHEKEDAAARKMGGFWKGCGCIPVGGCFGRPGREGRKRRRVWLGVCGGMLALITLGVVLGLVLSRRAAVDSLPYSPFLNLTNFPPMPTGISTVIGTDSDATTVCLEPSTLWTCSLPKEQASSVAPFGASQPSFIFHIQFDNNTKELWKAAGAGATPTPTPTPAPRPQARGEVMGLIPLLKRLAGVRRDVDSFDTGFSPEPAPPSFQDMFFLGNTTDGVVSDEKAGEPTPFFISVLRSIDESVGPNMLSRRASIFLGFYLSIYLNFYFGVYVDICFSIYPSTYGTGAPAVLLAHPKQQPVRLYDRGLPTERYGFYTYYDKTMYVKSTQHLDNTTPGKGLVADDLNGGALEKEAKFLVTFTSARYKVEIWTRRGNSTRLLGGGVSSSNSTLPGTFPYPITVTLDTHGGTKDTKAAIAWSVGDDQRVVTSSFTRVLNFVGAGGSLVNPAADFNPSFGGMDGGTGGWSLSPSLLTLAIESSCDDTCVAVLEKSGSAARLLFNKKVTSDNREFGGIYPMVTVRSHTMHLAKIVQEALRSLPERRTPDFITVTRGPGMTANLSIGLNTAKGLAVAMDVPLLGVHHMQAHALTPRLVTALNQPWPSTTSEAQRSPAFPFLTLLVSGGHSQLVLSRSLTSHAILATTNAGGGPIGNIMDKVARDLLPADVTAAAGNVMYGALLERFAFPSAQEDQDCDYEYTPPLHRRDEILPFDSGLGWTLTAPLADRRTMEYSFTGLGSQALRILAASPTSMGVDERRVLARGFMRVAFEHLASRAMFALTRLREQHELDKAQAQGGGDDGVTGTAAQIKTLVLSGGVASNGFLRRVMRSWLDVRGFGEVEMVAPPPPLCTDNAAMIAWTGVEMWEAGWRSDLGILPIREWSVDHEREDGGILGPEGWYRAGEGEELSG